MKLSTRDKVNILSKTGMAIAVSGLILVAFVPSILGPFLVWGVGVAMILLSGALEDTLKGDQDD